MGRIRLKAAHKRTIPGEPVSTITGRVVEKPSSGAGGWSAGNPVGRVISAAARSAIGNLVGTGDSEYSEWVRQNPTEALKADTPPEWIDRDNPNFAPSIYNEKRFPSALEAVFVGEKSPIANLKSLAKAKQMLQNGLSREEIYRATGWHRGIDGKGKWRFEIDDSDLFFDPKQSRAGKKDALAHTLYHPELEAATGKDFDRPNFRRSKKYEKGEGVYDEDAHLLDFSANPTTEDLLHEIQHYLQKKHGFERGSNPDAMKRAGHADPEGAYSRLAGEVEARVAALRSKMTKAEREAEPPWMTAEKMLRKEGLMKPGESLADVIIRRGGSGRAGKIKLPTT